MSTANTSRHHRLRARSIDFDKLTDDKLLSMRMSELGIRIQGTILETRVEQLYDELSSRGINFHPHCWLSEEWFSPDGVPGIAIPFYMANQRLTRLERKNMLAVEGGTAEECMKILRHEAGHAIDTAFRLRRKGRYRDVFGKVSQEYPEFYQPKPFSKSYVQHLDMWYAQSHPVEDFAETFAVWLKPRSRWRSKYKEWPALKKLEFVDELMHKDVIGQKPKVASREQIEPLREIKKTLGQHYRTKCEFYETESSTDYYDHDLLRLFSADPEHKKHIAASAFLNSIRSEIRKSVATWTGEYQYTVDQVLCEMIERSRVLKLRLIRSENETYRDAMILLTVQTMNYLHAGHHRVAL